LLDVFRVLGTCAQETKDVGAVIARSAAAQLRKRKDARFTGRHTDGKLRRRSCNSNCSEDERYDDIQGLHCEFEAGGFSFQKD